MSHKIKCVDCPLFITSGKCAAGLKVVDRPIACLVGLRELRERQDKDCEKALREIEKMDYGELIAR